MKLSRTNLNIVPTEGKYITFLLEKKMVKQK